MRLCPRQFQNMARRAPLTPITLRACALEYLTKTEWKGTLIMKPKTLALILCCMLCVSFLTACMPSEKPDFDKPSTVDPTIIEPTDKPDATPSTETDQTDAESPEEEVLIYGSVACYYWDELTEEEAYTDNTVILTGKISNVRPLTLEYEYLGADCTADITVFDVEVEEVLSCRSDAFSNEDVISVGIGYNMNTYFEGLPIIEEGASYLLFCSLTADDEEDPIGLSEYAECWISGMNQLFCEQVGDNYLVGSFFADVPGAVNIREALELTEEDCFALSVFDVNANPKWRSRSQIDFILKSPEDTNSAEKDGWLTVRSRARDHDSLGLWYLSDDFYLIDCDVLKEHVRTTAANYGG